jgi:hypothetical protein
MKTTNKTISGYHFTGDKLRNGADIPVIGTWLKFSGAIVPCQSGLHMSEHPLDALKYAPGNLLHKVELGGTLVSHCETEPTIDKWCGGERKILATINAEKLLHDFARWNALQVIHLWKAPAIVKQYLETGDKSIRAAARDAALDAAALDAAWDAARAAAWDAAWDAVRDAALDAAWDAARAAALDAAWDAARAAAWAAAWDAARDWDAAWDAAIEKSRAKFLEMVTAAFLEAK